MDKEKVITELNSKCEFRQLAPHKHSRAQWKINDIDIENNKIRNYCVNIYRDELGSRFATYEDKICDSCSQIINSYKNSYMIATSTSEQVLGKILEGMYLIKKNMEKTNERLNKIEKNIERIEESIERFRNSSKHVEHDERVEQSNSEPEEE